MDSPFTITPSSSFAHNRRMPPPQHGLDQTLLPGTRDFPLPIRSSSPLSGTSEGDSLTNTEPNLLPPLSFPAPSPNRKRRRETDTPSVSAATIAKSRRTTPSPALTGNTTPGSFDTLDFSQSPHLLKLLGGNPHDDLAEMRAEEEAQQLELQARLEQERGDAEIARQLAEAFECEPPLPSSAPPQRTFQSFLDSSLNLRRPDPPPQPILPSQPLPQPKSNFSALQRSGLSPSFGVAKNDYLRHSPQMYRNFIELDSDDDDEPVPPYASANDGHNSQGMNAFDTQWTGDLSTAASNGMPAATDSSSISGGAAGTVDSFSASGGSNIYDATYNTTYNTPGSSNWADRMNGFGQTFTGLASGAWASASNLLNQQNITYPTNDFGSYGHPISINSSSPPVIDLDSYDIPQQGMPGDWQPDPVMPSYPWGEEFHDRYMARVDYLQNDPTKTAAEIKNLLENIRPDEDLPENDREDTPDAMVYPLMKHQKLGLAWMKSMEDGSNKGGILADDMGLGKTIQALALMATRRSPDPCRKTTLVVAPLALIKQWEREIKSKLKSGREHQLTTYILHGQGRRATWEDLRAYDVVLTTYGTLSTEIKRKEGIIEAKRKNPNWRAITKSDRLPLLGDECKWYRVILDEAQCIKNKSTRAAHGACALQAVFRFCMSGTPMQNGVIELFSLVRFLRIKPYTDINRFNIDFTRPLKSTVEDEKNRAMQKLQALLKAIMLRRTKKSVIDGQPILSLPERTTESQLAQFSEDERQLYTALEQKVQLRFNKYLRAGTVGRNYSNVLVLLLRLRQACCHPHLIKDMAISDTSILPVEDLVKMAKELAPDAVTRLTTDGDPDEQSGLDCPVCMDVTENAIIFVPCGHFICSECLAMLSDPSRAIQDGDEGGSNNLKCHHCRRPVSTSRVTDFATFKKVYVGDNSAEEELARELGGPSDTDSESDSETDDEISEDEGSDLGGFIVNDDEETTDDEEGYRKGKIPFERCSKKPKAKKEKAKHDKSKPEGKRPKRTLAQLKKESLRNAKAKKKYMARLRKTWQTSSKIEQTIEILESIQAGREGEKTIIFSQFTSLLDLLEIPIYEKGWKCSRYDGSMSATARNDAVLEFQDKPQCKIMLVSLRAGNSGLNLVAASQVIIMDPFWNPYVEEQAIDRAHRIGQQRPVRVHRVLVPETVEDRILALQEKKRAMIESALDENASRAVGRLGVRELGYLF
ncbi:MAG: hypothetical protein L6R39_003136, partial [Caloplaca ligustica]